MAAAAEATQRARLASLQSQAAAVEREMRSITAELLSPLSDGQPPVGLKGNLVDKEGFPRADVDLVRVTTLRNRLAVLSTDLTDLNKQKDQALIELHASVAKANEEAGGDAIGQANKPNGKARRSDLRPFAKVQEVFEGSPASEAGLRSGDGVVIFDTFDEHASRAQGFAALATLVTPGRTLKVTIDPADGKGRKTVFLTPHAWSGQGMLGCRLVPV